MPQNPEQEKPYFDLVFTSVMTILNLVKLAMIKTKWKDIKPYEILLLTLSASDTCLAIGYTVYTIGRMLTAVDKNTLTPYAVAMGISSMTSIVALMLICIDRLIAVRMPLRHRVLVTCKVIVKAVALLWVLVFLTLYLPNFLASYNIVANMSKKAAAQASGYGLLAMQGLIFAAYAAVIYEIAKNRKRVQQHDARNAVTFYSAAEKIAFITCALTVASFIICTMPVTVHSIVLPLPTDDAMQWQEYFFLTNTIANPLIYFLKFVLVRKKIFQQKAQEATPVSK